MAAAVVGGLLGAACVAVLGVSFATGLSLGALAARAAAAVGAGGGSATLRSGGGYAGSSAASSRAATLGASLQPRPALSEKAGLLRALR